MRNPTREVILIDGSVPIGGFPSGAVFQVEGSRVQRMMIGSLADRPGKVFAFRTHEHPY
jgi:hypothetical protein